MPVDPVRVPDPDRHPRGDPSDRLQSAHRLTVGALTTLYVAVALLGALSAGFVVLLLVVPVTGLLGALIARGVHRALHPGVEAPLTFHLPVAVNTGLSSPFVIGMNTLGEDSVPVFIVLTLLSAVAGVGWAHALEPEAVGPRPPTPSDAELSSLRELLRALPVDELLHEWRWSGRRLRTDPHGAVRFRDLVLEEIQQRDPMGFRAWLLDGLEQDPGRHIRGDGADGATTGPPHEPDR